MLHLFAAFLAAGLIISLVCAIPIVWLLVKAMARRVIPSKIV